MSFLTLGDKSNSVLQGSPTFLKLRATSWYKFMRRATSLIHTLLKKKFTNFVFNHVSLIKPKDIHQC